jgi:putative ABC transport system permease protein
MGYKRRIGQIRSYKIRAGRFFTPFEMNSGRNTCVIGSTIADELFNNIDPLGRTITLRGKRQLL